jgi:hypothetical protein
MQTIATIGLDIAKSVFQVHGVDAGCACRKSNPNILVMPVCIENSIRVDDVTESPKLAE